jgi:hypothetical protein
MGTHLTERVVKAAEIGTRKYVIFDEACAGFGLCVFLSRRKTFILIYRAAGRQRRMTIGTWPSWSVIAAQEEAKRLKRDIDRGENPMDVWTSARHAPPAEDVQADTRAGKPHGRGAAQDVQPRCHVENAHRQPRHQFPQAPRNRP